MYRSNINSIGKNKFNNLNKLNILFYNIDNVNVSEIFINMKYLNIENTYLDKNVINYLSLDYVIGEYDEEILKKCNIKKIKYFFLEKEKNLLSIGKILQSIIDNKQYNIIYDNHTLKENKNILICGLGLVSNILINNLDCNLYIYDHTTIDEFDLCNQNIININDINKNKLEYYHIIYEKKNNVNKINIFNNDEFDKIDIIINTLEDVNERKKINDRCVEFNKICYDIGIEKSMGHIIPIIPNKTNKIYINQYRYKKEYPECKIENPEIIEHCIEHVKRYTDTNNIELFLKEVNLTAKNNNINTIDKYELENYILDRIPKLNSIPYYISGILINDYLYNENITSYYINLENELEIKYKDNELKEIKNEEFSNIYLSKVIVPMNSFTEWDYLEYRYTYLNYLINNLENKYNSKVFTIIMNNKLLYKQGDNINIYIIDCCKKNKIDYYKKNIINVTLTNTNYDTILLPKIYLIN